MILNYTKRVFILCIGLCIAFISVIHAQTEEPTFTVSITKGCVGLEVTVTSLVDSLPAVYDYGEGNGTTDETTHKYQKAGQFYITQYLVGSDGTGKKSSFRPFVEIFEPDKPQVEIQLCAQKQVLVSIREGRFTNYIVDFGDGTFDTMSVGGKAKVYTYQNTQPKTLNFSGFVAGMQTGCGTNPYTIAPIDSLEKPQLNHIEVTQNGSIQITLKTSDTGIYKLYENMSSGKNNEYELDYNLNSLLVSDVDTESETYNYRLETQDRCNSAPVLADAVLATYDVDLSTELGKNTLAWQNSTRATADCVMIYRDGTPIGVISNPLEQTFFEDTDVKCGQTYCYRIEVSLSNGKATSFSRQECIQTSSDSKPLPVNYAWASIYQQEGNDSTRSSYAVQLSWSIPKDEIIEPANIRIRKRIGADSMNLPIQTLIIPYQGNETGYKDTETNPEKISYGYYISYIDECGNASPETYITRPIILNYKTEDTNKDDKDDDIILSWTPYEGYSEVVYFLEKLDTLGNPYGEDALENQDSTFLRLSLLSLDSQSVTYRIKVISKLNPNLVSYSNTITYTQDAKLIYPTAFSPNWDGVNDEFRIYAFFIDKNRPIKVRILNRWGNPMYAYDNSPEDALAEGSDANILDFVWDGTAHSKHVPAGVYIIQIEAFDMLGNVIREKKTLTVLR